MHNDALTENGKNLEFVTLIAGQQSFCIDIKLIREIRRWSPVTKLPHSPGHVLGVMNLRGAVIPIIDLASILGFGHIDPTTRHVVIIASIEDRIVGLLVDSVSEILSITEDKLQETPRIRDDETNYCIQGIIAIEDDITRIIDLKTLLPKISRVAA